MNWLETQNGITKKLMRTYIKVPTAYAKRQSVTIGVFWHDSCSFRMWAEANYCKFSVYELLFVQHAYTYAFTFRHSHTINILSLPRALMLDQHSSTPMSSFITLWLFVWSWPNFNILLFMWAVHLLCEVSRMDAPNFFKCRRIKNAPLYIPYLLGLVMIWSHYLVMS